MASFVSVLNPDLNELQVRKLPMLASPNTIQTRGVMTFCPALNDIDTDKEDDWDKLDPIRR